MSGIATALAIGLTSDICPNSSIVRGTRPSVTTYCVCVADFSTFDQRSLRVDAASACNCARPVDAYRITATAPNDSQNPGHKTAHGSSRTTTPSAMHNTCETLVMRPNHSAAATTLSMYSVRCAGTPKPASNT